MVLSVGLPSGDPLGVSEGHRQPQHALRRARTWTKTKTIVKRQVACPGTVARGDGARVRPVLDEARRLTSALDGCVFVRSCAAPGPGPPPSACIRRAVCGDAGCGSRPAGGHRRGRGRGFYHCTARRIQGRRKEPGWGANPRPGRQALRRSARLSPKTGGRGGQLMRGE